MVECQSDMMVVGETHQGDQMLNFVRRGGFDVLLLEVALLGNKSITGIGELREVAPGLAILVLSSINDAATVYAAMRAGVNGYMSKKYSGAEVVDAVRKIVSGGIYISPDLARKLVFSIFNRTWFSNPDFLNAREFEIFALIASGQTPMQISDQLRLNVATVNRYRKRIMVQMNVSSVGELIRYAQIMRSTPKEHFIDNQLAEDDAARSYVRPVFFD